MNSSTCEQKQTDYDPSMLYIEPIGRCNLSCRYCCVQRDKTELSEEMVRDFIEQFAEKCPDVFILWIGWGEITLWKPFASVLNYLTEKYPQITHGIQTNGILLKEFLEKLPKNTVSKIVWIGISIDGLPKHHEFNRGAHTFAKTIAALQYAYDLPIETQVVSILTKENFDDSLQFLDFIEEKFPKSYIEFIYPYCSSDNAMFDMDCSHIKITKEDRRLIAQKLKEPKFKRILQHMYENWEVRYLTLSHFGIVYSCCEYMVELGNIHDSMHKLRRLVSDKISCEKCPLFNICSNCRSFHEDIHFL